MKPVRIWSRAGRRPIVDVGNSNRDIPMLQFAEKPNQMSLRMLLLHDKAREFDYTAGAERAIEQARERGWTIVSVKNHWAQVFVEPTSSSAADSFAAGRHKS